MTFSPLGSATWLFVLICLTVACTGFGGETLSEPFSSRQMEQVDSLLSARTNSGAGYAFGIIRDGKLVHSRGYGLANHEQRIPLTDTSVFYLASMSKQFTAAALLLLVEQGQVGLDDPVRDYLPNFPDYGTPISLRHLLHHTSGIRETNSLQLFAGIDRYFEVPFDTDDLLRLVYGQRKLNFSPGEQFRYSSGGYAVLAKVIERVSGQSFRTFLDQYIFTPLGMEDSFVFDDRHEVVPNRVSSYWPSGDGGWERRHHLFTAYGDGGVMTTIRDLVKWDRAFYDDSLLGVPDFAAKMYRRGQLNNGRLLEYAAALQIRQRDSVEYVTHNGGMLGFRVDMIRFPSEKTSIVLLGNAAYLDPTGDALAIADILLGLSPEASSPYVPKIPEASPGIKLSALAGHYWTDDFNHYRVISADQGQLYYDPGNPNDRSLLLPAENGTFTLHRYGRRSTLRFFDGGYELIADDHRATYHRFDPAPPTVLEEVEGYAGEYFSPELATTYRFFVEGNRLLFTVNGEQERQVFPVPANENIVWNGKRMVWIGYGEIKFHKDLRGRITGFHLGDGRVAGVWFERR